MHNELPQAGQLLGHNLERRSLWQTPVNVINWLFSPRPLLPWSVFSSEHMPNLSLHTLKLNSDPGNMVLDSCMRKFVNTSGLAWIFDNCVPSLAVLWPRGIFFIAWVIEDVHVVAVGSMSTILQVINQMLSVSRIHFGHWDWSQWQSTNS